MGATIAISIKNHWQQIDCKMKHCIYMKEYIPLIIFIIEDARDFLFFYD